MGWDKRVWRDLNYYSSYRSYLIHWPIEVAILVQLPVGLFILHMATEGTMSLAPAFWRMLQTILTPK